MNDRTLTRVSLFIAITGILAVVASTYMIEPKKVNLEEVGTPLIGENVEVTGEATGISRVGNNLFIELDNTSTVTVVVFGSLARNAPELKTGDRITVSGKVTLYKSSLEIVADSVKAL